MSAWLLNSFVTLGRILNCLILTVLIYKGGASIYLAETSRGKG